MIAPFTAGKNSLSHLNALVAEVNRLAGLLANRPPPAVGLIGFEAVITGTPEGAFGWTFQELAMGDNQTPAAIDGGRGTNGEVAYELDNGDAGTKPELLAPVQTGDRVFIRTLRDAGGLPLYVFNAARTIRTGIVTEVGANSLTMNALDAAGNTVGNTFAARCFLPLDAQGSSGYTVPPGMVKAGDNLPYVMLGDGTALVLGLQAVPNWSSVDAIFTAAGWLPKPAAAGIVTYNKGGDVVEFVTFDQATGSGVAVYSAAVDKFTAVQVLPADAGKLFTVSEAGVPVFRLAPMVE